MGGRARVGTSQMLITAEVIIQTEFIIQTSLRLCIFEILHKKCLQKILSNSEYIKISKTMQKLVQKQS